MDETTQSYTPYAWQNKQWQMFQRLIETDKLPHAVLISGPSEIGKNHFAKALVARMLCATPIDGQACLECKGCQLVNAGSHPDFLELVPEDKGKAISVDAIRGLAGFANKTAMSGGWRVALIDPAGAMTHNAANALLKTLEEPGKATLLILVHHQESPLIATIRSRCQLFLFPVPGQALATEWLANKVDVADCESLLELAGQRPLRAVRIVDDGSLEKITQVERMLSDVAAGLLSPVEAADQWKTVAPLDFIEWLLACHSKQISGNIAENKLPGRGHFVFLDQLLFARKLLTSKTNPNPQLLIEELLLGWRRLGSGSS